MALFNVIALRFTLCSAVISVTLYGQSWKVLYEHPHGSLTDIFFTDSSNGWIVGTDGIVLHSTDGGVSWHEHGVGTDAILTSIYFTDIENGWVVGETGEIFHTVDAGSTWVKHESESTYPLFRISFVNDSVGWIVGSGIIHKTTDAGETWVLLGEYGEEFSGGFGDAYFIDELEGWIAGADSYFDNFNDPMIWHTSDGGDTWDRRDPPDYVGPLWGVFFLDQDLGFVTSMSGILLKTVDGGLSWVEVLSDLYFAMEVTMTDSNNVWVADNNHIKHSSNAGSTWIDEWNWNGDQSIDPTYLSLRGSVQGWAVRKRTVVGYSEGSVATTRDYTQTLPMNPSLKPNYPNPFNATTNILYDLAKRSQVTLQVLDLAGREVTTLVSALQQAGAKHVMWDGSDNSGNPVSSGVYLLHVSAEAVGTGQRFLETRKLVLLR